MKKQSKLGFSLIELSIVIIIIGILIIGITKGSKIIENAKLNNARSLTENSPVSSIDNLELWLETTLDNSFVSDIDDGDAVATWYDLNNQNFDKDNATQSTSDYQPIYTNNAINGLPALRFDGSNDYMDYDPSAIVDNNYSVFIVEQRRGHTNNMAMIGASSSQSGSLNIQYSSDTNIRFSTGAGTADITVSAYSSPITRILAATYSLTNGKILYLNRGSTNTDATLTNYTNATDAAIGTADGSSTYYMGDIAEIIIFSRVLSAKEREAIENYLSQKWSVDLT